MYLIRGDICYVWNRFECHRFIYILYKDVTCLFQVLCPLLSNEKNHDQWPYVVSQDVRRHVHSLKSAVYVVSGQVKGKTLLPLPVGSDKVEEEAAEAEDK